MISQQKNTKKTKQKPMSSTLQKQFEIKQVIGRGTFGTVYLANWLTKDTKVAIKSFIKNPKYKNREVQVLTSLKNDSIIQLLVHYETYDEVSKKVYVNLVMEYVPTTLLTIIRNGNSKNNKIQFEKIVLYARKILQGLAYMEEKNICHRDIKPSNVLIDQTDNRVKICDFGSAKQLKKQQKSITYICSRYYRAPELILGCSQYSTKIDIWAAGCVICQMVTLHPLFDGSNNVDQIAKIVKVLGPPIKEDLNAMKVDGFNGDLQNIIAMGIDAKIKKASPNCPAQFIDLIEKLVLYNPEKRLSAKQALEHPVFKKYEI